MTALTAADQSFPGRTEGACTHRNLTSRVQKRKKRRKERTREGRGGKETFSLKQAGRR